MRNPRSYTYGEDRKYISTKKVLLQSPSKGQNKHIIFCPAFLRIQIDGIKNLQLGKLEAELKIQFKLDIDVTDIPEQIVKDVIKDRFKIHFCDEASSLKVSDLQVVDTPKDRMMGENRIIGYRFHKITAAKIIPDIFWTPFERLDLIMSIRLNHIEIWDKEQIQKYVKLFNGKKDVEVFAIKFNFMQFKYGTWYNDKKQQYDLVDSQAQIAFREVNFFGNYSIAQAMVNVQFSKKKTSSRQKQQVQNIKNEGKYSVRRLTKNDEKVIKRYKKDKPFHSSRKRNNFQDREKEKKLVKPFRYAHFEIPIYRIPLVSFFTVFIPIWILGLISLLIFEAEFTIIDRIATIATILLAYVAFMPTIRQTLPPSPNLVFVQILLYLQILVTLLAFFQTFALLVQEKEKYEWRKNPFLIISIIIQSLTTVSFLSLIITYNCYWKPSYNILPGTKVILRCQSQEWRNSDCDKEFSDKVNYDTLEISEFKKNQSPPVRNSY